MPTNLFCARGARFIKRSSDDDSSAPIIEEVLSRRVKPTDEVHTNNTITHTTSKN